MQPRVTYFTRGCIYYTINESCYWYLSPNEDFTSFTNCFMRCSSLCGHISSTSPESAMMKFFNPDATINFPSVFTAIILLWQLYSIALQFCVTFPSFVFGEYSYSTPHAPKSFHPKFTHETYTFGAFSITAKSIEMLGHSANFSFMYSFTISGSGLSPVLSQAV